MSKRERWWENHIHVTLVRDIALEHPLSEDARRHLAKRSKSTLKAMAKERPIAKTRDPVFYEKHVPVDQSQVQREFLARQKTPQQIWKEWRAAFRRRTGRNPTVMEALKGTPYGERTELARWKAGKSTNKKADKFFRRHLYTD